MYSLAPRCSEPWSPRSVPACWTSPPAAARAEADSSRPAAAMANLPNMRARIRESVGLFMRGHPFRQRLGFVELRPDRHGQEDQEVHGGEDAADDRLDRVGARAGADLAQPDEAD